MEIKRNNYVIDDNFVCDVAGNSWEGTCLRCAQAKGKTPTEKEWENYLDENWGKFPYHWKKLNVVDSKTITFITCCDNCN